MATVPSNKSSSPIPGRANPNARSSEIGNPMRRSFTGNPFGKPSLVPNPRGLNPNTPVNSPSEFPRRNSASRESVVTLRDNEDKENGKMAKVRSPMVSKGAKNFMSPTISAASKINASPRKKILEERNEPVRASVSFSDFKVASFGQEISDSSNQRKEEEEIIAAPLVSADSQAKSGSKPKKVMFVEPEPFNLESNFKISPSPPTLCSSSPSVPIIAPLDSDPLAPPYDPKTNYLSPRPRFLHYKPNPRVELYLSKTKEGKWPEDSFLSGSFSDTEATEEEEEETLSESLLKESEDDVSLGEEVRAEEKQEQQEKEKEEEEEEEEEIVVTEAAEEEEEETLSESLLKESEDDVSLGEEVRAEEKQEEQEKEKEEEEEEEEEEEIVVSEPSPIEAVISEEAVEAKRESKPRSVWRSKWTALLIILSIVFVSILVATSPVIDHSVFDSTRAFLKQYDHSEFVEFAKASFDGITQKFHVWYGNSISSLSELISNLRGAHKVEPLHYFNLTPSIENDVPFDGYAMNMFVPTREKGEFHIAEDRELQIDAEHEEQVHEEGDKASSEVEEMPEMHITPSEEVGQAPNAEVVEQERSAAEKNQEENDLSGGFEHEPIPVVQADEAQLKVSEAGESQDEVKSSDAELEEPAKEDPFSYETPEVYSSTEGTKHSGEVMDVIVDERKKGSFSNFNVLAMAFLVLALIASIGSVFVKKRNNSNSNAFDITTKGRVFETKKLDSSPTLSKPGNTFAAKPSSWDYSGESCPSGMSSYQNTSYNDTKGLNSLHEAQSHERKSRRNQKRESMASSSIDSSMGSQSYGSFTTFERIPTKYGHGDEEFITPVRRSSRLRTSER